MSDYINKDTKKSGDTTLTAAQKEDIIKKVSDLLNCLFKKKKPAEETKTP